MVNDLVQLLRVALLLFWRPTTLLRELRIQATPLWRPVSIALLVMTSARLVADLAHVPPSRMTGDMLVMQIMVADSQPTASKAQNPISANALISFLQESAQKRGPRQNDRLMEMIRGRVAEEWGDRDRWLKEAVRITLFPGITWIQLYLEINCNVRYADQIVAAVSEERPEAGAYLAGFLDRHRDSISGMEVRRQMSDASYIVIFALLVLTVSFRSLSLKASVGLACYLCALAQIATSVPFLILAHLPVPLLVTYMISLMVQPLLVEVWLARVVPRALDLPVAKTLIIGNCAYLLLVMVVDIIFRAQTHLPLLG